MSQYLLIGLLLLTAGTGSNQHFEFTISPRFSSYHLFFDEEDSQNTWRPGGDLGVFNIIPHIGLKLSGTILTFEGSGGYVPDEYEYIPLTFCTSFNLLPFLDVPWLRFTGETGIGLYSWRGLLDGEVFEFPSYEGMELMEETDIGFVGGLTLQLRLIKYIGIEIASRYHYMATADIYKYGFTDADDKIWENGAGLTFFIPAGW